MRNPLPLLLFAFLPTFAKAADFPHNPNLPNNQYSNPIIYADYSDPDVIRVNDDYYMTASSFSCFPALPILHSKDLVNWQLIAHTVQHYPEPQRQAFQLPQHGGGIWAPSIRFHNNTFFIFFGDPDHGIFMTTATDPKGPWSPLHLVQKSYGWIDICPFWDDDGNAYLVHAFANSRSKLSNILWLHRMSPDGTRLLDDGHLLFDARGTYTTLEGPKLYKRNGFYYVLAPGGGVTSGYQLAFRSKNIDGPYDHRIVLDSGTTNINGPHQDAWIDTPDGKEDWFIHFQELLPYGRITHLQPLTWQNDWPLIGEFPGNAGVSPASAPTKGQPALTHKKPNLPAQPVAIPQTSDDFTAQTLALQWQWWSDFQDTWFSLTANPGNLRLYAVPSPTGHALPLYDRPNLLLQKFPARTFTATAKLDPSHLSPGTKAGLVLAGKTTAALHLERTPDNHLKLTRTNFTYRNPPTPRGTTQPKRFDAAPYDPLPPISITPPTSFPAPATQPPSTQPDTEEATTTLPLTTLYLRLTCAANARCTLSYATENDANTFTELGRPLTPINDTWIGAKLGLFCNAPSASTTIDQSSYLDIDWIHFE